MSTNAHLPVAEQSNKTSRRTLAFGAAVVTASLAALLAKTSMVTAPNQLD